MIITNTNFNSITEYLYPLTDITNKAGFIKEPSGIKFYTTTIACPCIYVYKDSTDFAYSLDFKEIFAWMQDNDKTITQYSLHEAQEFTGLIGCTIKKSVLDTYIRELTYIENWKEVTIDSTGNIINIVYSDFEPFTVSIEDSYDILCELFTKYKNLVRHYIDNDDFTPTITGGLDTRYLSSFYIKDTCFDKSSNWHIQDVKNDGKNAVEKGKTEINIATTIVGMLGITGDRTSTLHKKTLSGLYNENARFIPSDKHYLWIPKIIQHDSKNVFKNLLMPFTDELYLRIKQERRLMRCLLSLILIPELLDIGLIGTTRDFYVKYNGAYCFKEIYYKEIIKAQKILNNWGNDKVEHLRKIVYTG